MDTLGRATGALFAAGALLALASCTNARDLPEGDGMHQEGWSDPKSDGFHAKWFQAKREAGGDEPALIKDCQKCHGDDFGGGAVGVSCTKSSCHTQKNGPEFCGTCHGDKNGPMPTTGPFAGAHEMHKAFCDDCHHVPAKFAAPGHVDGKVDVIFSGLAVANGSKPVFDPETKTCANVYCHAGGKDCASGDKTDGCEPKWEKPKADAPCNFCHQTPPAESHKAWASVVTATNCENCHPKPDKPAVGAAHIDTKIELADSEIQCWTCHGSPPDGAPAPSLDGSTDISSPGVGAHRRHLDPTLPGRIGHVVACNLCHKVPAAWWSPGHILDASGNLDADGMAEVSLPFGGTFDATSDPKNPTCVVACHFDKPKVWTQQVAGVPDCTSCHEFPPKFLRDGTPHTQAPPQLDACLKCHPFSPATHVDGTIDLLP